MTDFITQAKANETKEDVSLKIGGKYIDILHDRFFKMVFTKEESKSVLINILNAFVPELQIKDLSFLPQEQNPEQKDLKASAFDVSAKTTDGRSIIVEVQYNSRPDYLDRVLYYSTWPISKQVLKGGKSYRLNTVYIINFCNFALVHNDDWGDRPVATYSIREDHNGEIMTQALHFVFIELGRMDKTQDELKGVTDQWAYSMLNIGRLDRKPASITDENVSQLYDITRIESMSIEEKELYKSVMRTELDIQIDKNAARAEGLAEGEAKGKAEGLAEGDAKGKLSTAKSFKSLGIDIDTIVAATGLSREEVEAL